MGPWLDWNYSEDPVGNITAITDALAPSGNRTYAYQDYQYFLTSAVGPWGPLYASEGMLYSRRQRRLSTFSTEQDDNTVGITSADATASLFYFAGRPIAQLTTRASGPANGLVYLTTDHLGTPTLATNTTGGVVWSRGFMPFGAPYQVMLPELFLRLPGQWTDRSWEGVGSGSSNNVHRWYGGTELVSADTRSQTLWD